MPPRRRINHHASHSPFDAGLQSRCANGRRLFAGRRLGTASPASNDRRRATKGGANGRKLIASGNVAGWAESGLLCTRFLLHMAITQQIALAAAETAADLWRASKSALMLERKGPGMRKERFVSVTDCIARVMRREASRPFYTIVFLTFCMTLGLSLSGPASAECLKNPHQLSEKRVSTRWVELHQKDNQPLFLSINAGPGDELYFVGKKPDGSTWISGAMSICSYAENRYQVKLERIDQAPAFVGLKLTGMSATIPAGSSNLKFGTGQHCGNPDACIEFAAQ
jgi:hypothetical protein